MALKKKITKLEDVDAPLRTLYEKQADGTFTLAVEDDEGDTGDASAAKDRAKLKEFREANILLQKHVKDVEAKLAAVNLEEYEQGRQMLSQVKDEQERKDFAAGKLTVADLVAKRMEPLRKDYEAKLKAADEKAAIAAEQAGKGLGALSDLKIAAAMRKAADALKVQIVPGGEDDVAAFAKRYARLNQTSLEPELVDGEDPLYGRDGKPETFEGLVNRALEAKPHYFQPGEGGGARGGVKNPRQPGKQVVESMNGMITADAAQRAAIQTGNAIVR